MTIGKIKSLDIPFSDVHAKQKRESTTLVPNEAAEAAGQRKRRCPRDWLPLIVLQYHYEAERRNSIHRANHVAEAFIRKREIPTMFIRRCVSDCAAERGGGLVFFGVSVCRITHHTNAQLHANIFTSICRCMANFVGPRNN